MYIWALSRWFYLFRWLSCAFQWFNFGSAWMWTVLTVALLVTTTRATVDEMMPDNNGNVGMYVVLLLVLHFWGTILLTFVFTPQYGEHIAVFWYRAVVYTAKYTYATTILFLFIVIMSPSILWIIYLAIFDPIEVYDVAPQYAKSWAFAFFVGMATLFFSQIFLGWYLDHKVRDIIKARRKSIEASEFPKESKRSKLLATLRQPDHLRLLAREESL